MRRSCFFSSLLLLLALQAAPEPAVTAAWLGDDALSVVWSGPGCLYYARPGHGLTWLTCDAGAVQLAEGGDAAYRPEPGGRLVVAENLAQPLVEGRVPWRVVLPLVMDMGAPQLRGS